MNSYGDAINWCIQNGAVIRFVNRDMRREFYRELQPGDVALELALDIDGKTYVAHMPLDKGMSPGMSVGLALMGCIKFFLEKRATLAASAAVS
jgi:hypothetical protein